MCSIFKYKHCVGRNFDYDVSYDEELRVIRKGEYNSSYDIIGMCTGLVKDYPLLYDGMNEKGLVCGALAFDGNAYYKEPDEHKFSPPSYEFVLYILRTFKTVKEVKDFISNDMFQISNESYSKDMPSTDLHWFVVDMDESIIVEQTKDGLNVYDGDVMTNNPPYPIQKREYEISKDIIGWDLYFENKYNTRGMNSEGLDGSLTSDGRFERLSWIKEQLEKSGSDFNDISQSFHLLSSVEQIYGATPVDDRYEYTIYSVVYDMENLDIYLKRYDDLIIKEEWI